MAQKFPPSREADLLAAAQLFDAKATSMTTSIGISSAQAAAFHALVLAFGSARTTALDPLTRSPANIIAKDLAKANLISNFRLLVGIVQRFPGMTNFVRSELGIPLRSTEPTPIPAPAAAPLVEVRSVVGRTARIRLRDAAHPTRLGKPAGCSGAAVFSYVGATPPTELSDWKFEGNTGRTVSIDVAFPPTVPNGALVWLTAFWFNPRKQAGPLAEPAQANLPGGGVTALAA